MGISTNGDILAMGLVYAVPTVSPNISCANYHLSLALSTRHLLVSFNRFCRVRGDLLRSNMKKVDLGPVKSFFPPPSQEELIQIKKFQKHSLDGSRFFL